MLVCSLITRQRKTKGANQEPQIIGIGMLKNSYVNEKAEGRGWRLRRRG